MRRLLKCRQGATAIEYAFIAMLIGLVILAGVTSLGKNTANKYNNIANKAAAVM